MGRIPPNICTEYDPSHDKITVPPALPTRLIQKMVQYVGHVGLSWIWPRPRRRKSQKFWCLESYRRVLNPSRDQVATILSQYPTFRPSSLANSFCKAKCPLLSVLRRSPALPASWALVSPCLVGEAHAYPAKFSVVAWSCG